MSSPSQHQLEEVAGLFKALSDPMRLKMLLFIALHSGECCSGTSVCACDLEKVTELSQPTVSHHMKILLQAGIVQGRKNGKWMYYTIRPEAFKSWQEFLPLLER